MEHKEVEALSTTLGASRSFEAGRVSGPLDLLALRREIGHRFRSSGGRPSDPSWTISRQIPFSEPSWKRLRVIANEIGVDARRIGPGQLAAMLVEHGLRRIEDDHWHDVLASSRRAPEFTGAETADIVAVTFRQLVDWTTTYGELASRTQGALLFFDHDAVIRLKWLRLLSSADFGPERLPALPSRSQISHRYILTSRSGVVRYTDDSAEFAEIIATDGEFDAVIDQLPLRKRLLGVRDMEGEEENGTEAHAV